MPRLENRSQMMEYLGAEQRNTVWSWCAVNEEERKVYFSMWEDTHSKDADGNHQYLIQEPSWGVDEETGKKTAARNDHDEKLALVFDSGYQPFGYIVVARDKHAYPREIEETRTGFVFELAITREPNGDVRARVISRINLR